MFRCLPSIYLLLLVSRSEDLNEGTDTETHRQAVGNTECPVRHVTTSSVCDAYREEGHERLSQSPDRFHAGHFPNAILELCR
jgi:hypothetical protein